MTNFSETKSPSRILLLAAALILLLVLATTSLTPSARAVPKAPLGFLGVVPAQGISNIDTARMHRGKVKSLRLAISWGGVQKRKRGKYHWTDIDNAMYVAAERGVQIMPTLYGTPEWMSRRFTNLPVESRAQLDSWRKFVKAAVKRYGKGGDFWKAFPNVKQLPVREWQIWNEANFYYFATPVSPAKYGRLLDASAKVIHKTDKKAEVVVSGLFARPKGSSRRAMDAVDYIRKLPKYSLNRSVDSIAIHPYAADTATLREIMKQFRRAAIQAGYRKKSIQVTEMGWGSGPKTNSFLTGSEAAQARQLKSAFTYLVGDRKKLRLKNVYWFSWRDPNPALSACSFCYSIGLFNYRKNGKLPAKPAWNQYVRFTRGKP